MCAVRQHRDDEKKIASLKRVSNILKFALACIDCLCSHNDDNVVCFHSLLPEKAYSQYCLFFVTTSLRNAGYDDCLPPLKTHILIRSLFGQKPSLFFTFNYIIFFLLCVMSQHTYSQTIVFPMSVLLVSVPVISFLCLFIMCKVHMSILWLCSLFCSYSMWHISCLFSNMACLCLISDSYSACCASV